MPHGFQLHISSEADAERFVNLYTFAQSGRVIVAWDTIAEDDPDFDEEGDNAVPVFDDSDRSDDPWFPLAQALSYVSYGVVGTDEPGGLRFSAEPGNDELVLAAAESVGVPASVV